MGEGFSAVRIPRARAARNAAPVVAANVGPALLYRHLVERSDMPAPFARRMYGYKTGSGTFLGKRMEVVAQRANGQEFPAELAITVVQGAQGSQFIGFLRDITERRQAEQALRQTLADLNNRNRELQDFAFIASHDLQEPLRKIRAFSDRLQERHAAQLAPEARDYLDRTGQAAARMQTLIDDLLAYSRVVARGKPFAQVDLDKVLSEVIEDLEARLESSGGRIERGPLPTIEADPTQMRQMLQNLLSNALKFRSPDRAPVVTISAEPSPAEDGPGWILRFEDNGIGFDPRYADKVFAPFQRLHARQEYEGTGIGLAIVRRIIERHRGDIHAEGRPGEGATFVIRLPQTQPADPALLAGPMAES